MSDMYVCVFCIYIYIYIICMSVCVCMRAHLYIKFYHRTLLHTSTGVRRDTRARTHTHTHTHTHTQIYNHSHEGDARSLTQKYMNMLMEETLTHPQTDTWTCSQWGVQQIYTHRTQCILQTHTRTHTRIHEHAHCSQWGEPDPRSSHGSPHTHIFHLRMRMLCMYVCICMCK
jgi:hypothetical protein